MHNKVLFVGMVGKHAEYLATDFLIEFRKFAKNHEDQKRFAFTIVDVDDLKNFRWINKFAFGRFDTPSIFALKDLEQGIFYRNYETYDGLNFQRLSEEFMNSIKTNEKLPLYSNPWEFYKNIGNIEYWMNNLLKAYIYSIGMVSVVVIPTFIVIDCFFPILGRSPAARKRRTEKTENTGDNTQQKGEEKKTETKKNK